MPKFLFEGFGIIDDRTSVVVDGTSMACKHYATWTSMIIRCYSERHRSKYQAYKGCTVDERWRLFSEFKKWREERDWEGKHLDKDLIVENNRVYGPDTCAMIIPQLNSFLTRMGSTDLMEGVIYNKATNMFKPIGYTNPFVLGGKKQADTSFETEEDAHIQWLKNKHEMALIYAKRETDPRIIKALTTRWAKAEQY